MPADKGGSRALLRGLRAVMAGPGDGQQRLDKVVRLVASNMVAEVCSIYLKRDERTLELCATEGLKQESVHTARLRIGQGLVGRLAEREMYGTFSARGASAVAELGGIPVDYQQLDFAQEMHRLTGEGVDVVFDGIGGTHIWRSRTALRPGGRVVAYGLTASLRGGR